MCSVPLYYTLNVGIHKGEKVIESTNIKVYYIYMKHIFIINPKAGKGLGQSYVEKISRVAQELNVEYDIFLTKGKGDGELRVSQYIIDHPKENIRFYAMGGDGTLNEVVNGAYGNKKVEVACIPTGSGNDFVRNFVRCGDFMSIKSQILGKAMKIDVMSFSGIVDGVNQSRVAINMFNIGFDANVASDMNKFRNVKLLPSGSAYRFALGTNFIKKKGGNLTVIADGEVVHTGKLFFVNICNGTFLGGGMKGAPMAVVDDGKIDMNIIKDISRKKFLELAPKYMKGTHMLEPGIEEIITYRQPKEIKVVSNIKDIKLGVDGEIHIANGVLDFKVIPKGLRFSLPKVSDHK